MISLEEQCYHTIIDYIVRQRSNIPFSIIQKYLINELLSYPSICDEVLERIVKFRPKALSNEVFLNLIHSYTSVIVLNVHSSRISHNVLNTAIRKCHHYLKELRLLYNTFIHLLPVLHTLNQKKVAITHLVLDNCDTIKDSDTLFLITQFRQSLQVLSLLECKQLTDDAFDIRTLAPQMSYFPCALTHLSISSPHLTDQIIPKIVFIGRGLLMLDIGVRLTRPESFLLLSGFPVDATLVRNLEDFTIGLRVNGPVLRRCHSVQRDLVRSLTPIFHAPGDVPPENQSNSNFSCLSVQCSETLVQEVVPVFRPQLRELHVDLHGAMSMPNGQLLFRLLLLSCHNLIKLDWTDQKESTSINGIEIESDIAQPFLCSLAQLRPDLQSLVLRWCGGFLPECLYPLRLLSQLNSLSLHGLVTGDDAIITSIIQNNPALLHVRLPGSDIGDETAKALADIVGYQIETLDLSWCDESLTHHGVALIARVARNLRYLNLRLAYATRRSILRFVQRNTKLEQLHLHCIQRPVEFEEEEEDEEDDNEYVPREPSEMPPSEIITDSICNAISHLNALVVLDVSFNIDVTDIGVRAILQGCTKLEKFKLSNCKCITAKPFTDIVPDYSRFARYWAALQVIQRLRLMRSQGEDVGSSSSDELEDIYFPCRSITYAPRLNFVDFTGCDLVKDDIVTQLVKVCRSSLTAMDYYGRTIE